jgi:hypothetical protein
MLFFQTLCPQLFTDQLELQHYLVKNEMSNYLPLICIFVYNVRNRIRHSPQPFYLLNSDESVSGSVSVCTQCK